MIIPMANLTTFARQHNGCRYPAVSRLWFFPVILISAICWSAPAIPPTINLQWSIRTYQVTAPPPFGDIQVTMSIGSNQRLVGLEIWVGDDALEVPAEIYANIFNPGEIDVAYSDPRQTTTKSVEYAVLAFEFGDSYRIEYEAEIAGCDSPCIDTVRDIAQIRVNADLSLISEISSLRYLAGGGA